MFYLSQRSSQSTNFRTGSRLTALLIVALAAWLSNTAIAAAERNSSVDQYLEQTPSAGGNKSDRSGGGTGGSGGGNGSGQNGSSSGGSSSGGDGSGEGSGAKTPAERKKAREKRRKEREERANNGSSDDTAGDRAGDGEQQRLSSPAPAGDGPNNGGGDGSPVGLIALIVVLTGAAGGAVFLRRRLRGGETSPHPGPSA